ncbi:hypothetical protein [Baaleninema sp.]
MARSRFALGISERSPDLTEARGLDRFGTPPFPMGRIWKFTRIRSRTPTV